MQIFENIIDYLIQVFFALHALKVFIGIHLAQESSTFRSSQTSSFSQLNGSFLPRMEIQISTR